MGVVVEELEVLETEGKEVLDVRIDPHDWELTGVTGQLLTRLVDMVEVKVDVPESVDEVSRLEVADLRDHHREQGVRRDVEWHAEEGVGRPLVELAAQAAILHMELEQAMARGQGHLLDEGGIPGTHDVAPAVRVVLDSVDELYDLVGMASAGVGPGPPLVAVNGTEVAVLVGPLIPDADPILLEVGDVGVALQEPQELVDDAAQVQLLGRQDGKTLRQVETHLVAEQAEGTGSGPIGTLLPLVEELLQQVEILLHLILLTGFPT